MIAIKAQDIADGIKSGALSSLSDQLNSMSETERLDICRKADEINHRMRSSNSALPDLQLDIGCVDGMLVLKDVRVVKSDGQSFDLYDRPAGLDPKPSTMNEPATVRQIEPTATSTILPTPLPPVSDSLRRPTPSDRSESAGVMTPLPGERIQVERVVGASSATPGMLPTAQPQVADSSRRIGPSDRSESAGATTPVPGARIEMGPVVGASSSATGQVEKPRLEKSSDASGRIEHKEGRQALEVEHLEKLAAKIAKLVLEKGDFGAAYKRSQVEKAFDELTLAGGGKLDLVVEKVNDYLKKLGSPLTLRSSTWSETARYYPVFHGNSQLLVDILPHQVNEPRSRVEIVNATDGEVADEVVSAPQKGVESSNLGGGKITWVRSSKLDK